MTKMMKMHGFSASLDDGGAGPLFGRFLFPEIVLLAGLRMLDLVRLIKFWKFHLWVGDNAMGVAKSRETVPPVGSKPGLNTVKTPHLAKLASHTHKFVPDKCRYKINHGNDQNDENAWILSLSGWCWGMPIIRAISISGICTVGWPANARSSKTDKILKISFVGWR